jgi:hypothetical protein
MSAFGGKADMRAIGWMPYNDTKRKSCDGWHIRSREHGLCKSRYSKIGGDHVQLENTGMRPRDFCVHARHRCASDARIGNPSLMCLADVRDERSKGL